MSHPQFGIQTIGGKISVTDAQQDAAKHDDVAGTGHGFVDVFHPNGDLLGRLVSRGPLDPPWGFALAPSGFGQFSGVLPVANFGDGTINTFDPTTGAFVGTPDDAPGNPIMIEGRWACCSATEPMVRGRTTCYSQPAFRGPGA